MLRSRSGRRSSGLSAGVGAAEGQVVAAAGAGVGAVEVELLGAEAGWRARRRARRSMMSTSSGHDAAGWMLTSSTPGSGVTARRHEPRVVGGRYPSSTTGRAERGGGVLDDAEQVDRVLDRAAAAAGTRRACPSRTSTHSAVRGTSSGSTSLPLAAGARPPPCDRRAAAAPRTATGPGPAGRRLPGEGVERQAQRPSASRPGSGRGGRGAASSGSSPTRGGCRRGRRPGAAAGAAGSPSRPDRRGPPRRARRWRPGGRRHLRERRSVGVDVDRRRVPGGHDASTASRCSGSS